MLEKKIGFSNFRERIKQSMEKKIKHINLNFQKQKHPIQLLCLHLMLLEAFIWVMP